MTKEEALLKVKGYLTDLLPSEEYDEVEEILKALGQEFKAESEVRGMTREEAEQAISEKVAELWEIYKEYNPKGYSLSLAVTDNLIIVNNEYWKDDINNPLTKIIERKGANTWTDQATKEDIEQDIKQE